MTSDALILAIIAVVPSTLAAVAALAGVAASRRNGRKVDQLQINVDGRLQQLLDQTGIASRAEGKAEGVKEEKQYEQTRKDITAAALASVPVAAPVLPAGPVEMKIINSPAEPVPVLATDAETKPEKTK